MNDQSDQRLLRAYAERQSEAAFAVIVQRYVDLVYSAALRMVCDAHAAKDVTQAVFVLLAQNAGQLTDRPALAGWLHCTARNLAVKTVRSEARRRAREQEAAVMNELRSAHPDTSWDPIAPHLDEALSGLNEPDREAVLLRYFKNHDLRTVGATLGISDDAAQKRVSRAVERLREFFAKRGVTVGASGLAVVISANAVQAAPVGLAFTISAATALIGTTLATTATITATKAIAMTALQKTIVTATIAVLAGVGIYENRQAAQLRRQVQTLQQRRAEQIAQLDKALIDSTNQLTALRDDNERLNRNTSDLLRLRGEVSELRAKLAQKAKPDTTTAPQAAQAEQPINELEQQRQAGIRKQQAIAKMGYGRNWLLAFLQYAEQNNGQLPTSFDQSVAFLPDAARDETMLATNQFEIVAQGSISALTNVEALIVLRELHAQQVNGGWVKTYVFADGHSEVHKETDGNFETWEAQRMLPPVTPNP